MDAQVTPGLCPPFDGKSEGLRTDSRLYLDPRLGRFGASALCKRATQVLNQAFVLLSRSGPQGGDGQDQRGALPHLLQIGLVDRIESLGPEHAARRSAGFARRALTPGRRAGDLFKRDIGIALGFDQLEGLTLDRVLRPLLLQLTQRRQSDIQIS